MSIQATELIVDPAVALETMPRSRELGKEVLDFYSESDRKVLSGDDFVYAIHLALADIEKWAGYHTEIIPEQAVLFQQLTDQELRNMQRSWRFSGVQVRMWRGEMKLQINAWKQAETHQS